MARTQWTEIAAAIRTQLLKDFNVTEPGLVRIVARREEIPHITGDRDILLRLKGLASPQDVTQGAGRIARAYRNVEITVRMRDNTDRSDSDEYWLLRQDEGLAALEAKVFDSLQMFHPESSDGQKRLLLGEPMRLLNSTDPSREMLKAGKIQGWGSSTMVWQVMFEPQLDHATRQ